MQSPTPSAPPEPGTSPATSFFAKLANIVASPGEVFDEIQGKPVATVNWVGPLILSICLGVIFVFVIFSQDGVVRKIRDGQEAAFQENVKAGKMTQQQADQAMQMVERFAGPTMLKIFGSVGAVAGSVGGLFLTGLLFWGAARVVFKAEIDYLKAVEAVGLATVIGAVDLIIRIPLAILTENPPANLGPVLLLRPFDPTSAMHMALAAVSVVTIWYLAVLSVGLARLARVSWAKAFLVILPVWMFFTTLSLLPVVIQGMIKGMTAGKH